MSRARPSSRGAGAVAVAAVSVTTLLSMLVAWAASVGPGEVLEGDGPGRLAAPSPTATSATADGVVGPLTDRTRPPSEEPSLVFVVVAVGLMVLVGLALIGLLVLLVRYLWGLRLPDVAADDDDSVDFEVLGASSSERLVRALASDAEAQRRALAQGSPRNAIVACWQRFEEGAAAVGVRPRESETSTEFGRRVLETAGADSEAVAALAAEFRRARFSEHDIGEDARERAVALLDAVQAGLGHSRGAPK